MTLGYTHGHPLAPDEHDVDVPHGPEHGELEHVLVSPPLSAMAADNPKSTIDELRQSSAINA